MYPSSLGNPPARSLRRSASQAQLDRKASRGDLRNRYVEEDVPPLPSSQFGQRKAASPSNAADDLARQSGAPTHTLRPSRSRQTLRAVSSTTHLKSGEKKILRNATSTSNLKRTLTKECYEPPGAGSVFDPGRAVPNRPLCLVVRSLDEVELIEGMASLDKHLRYLPQDEIVPLTPPRQTGRRITNLCQGLETFGRAISNKHNPLTTAATGTNRPNPSPKLDPTGILPKINFAHSLSPHVHTDSSTGESPDGYVKPSLLLRNKGRKNYEQWINEVGLYGSVSETEKRKAAGPVRGDALALEKRVGLPDLFSRVHSKASRSNGNLIVVTMIRDVSLTRSSPTQVFVSPAPTVSLEPLGEAALLFKQRFDHLLAPMRYLLNGNVRKEEELGDIAVDRVLDREEQEVQRELKVGIPVRLQELDMPVQMDYMGQGEVITEQDLQQVISYTARVLGSPNVLTPGCHGSFPRYGAVFHTHERGCTKWWPDEEKEKETRGVHAEEVDEGYDMRFVTALTGAIGATFCFRLDPQTNHVSVEVFTSWHFWEQHARSFIQISSLLLEGVRPSFVLTTLVKKGIASAGWRLPPRPTFAPDRSPTLPDVIYKRYRDDCQDHVSESLWDGYPESTMCLLEQNMVRDFFRELVLTRLRPAFSTGAAPPPYVTPLGWKGGRMDKGKGNIFSDSSKGQTPSKYDFPLSLPEDPPLNLVIETPKGKKLQASWGAEYGIKG